MSGQEQETLIGKMVLEKAALTRDVALLMEIFTKLSEDLQVIQRMLPGQNPIRYFHSTLPENFREFVGDGSKLIQLISEYDAKNKRLGDLANRIAAATGV